MLDRIKARFDQNLARVENLIRVYRGLGEGRGRRPVSSSDILRAATVLLHASLEDFLRSLAKWRWQGAGPDVLEGIPLPGTASPARRGEKFTLGDLARHRGKDVEALIGEAVEAYLDRSNYNNTSQVAELLASVGVDVDRVNSRFTDLDDMMGRRHWIVHQADHNPQPGRGHHQTKSLSIDRVQIWVGAVTSFVESVVRELQPQQHLDTHVR